MFTYYTKPNDDTDDDYYLDYFAAVLQVLCVAVCVVGLRLGKLCINVFTVAKLILVAFMIIAALCCWDENIFESPETFAPEGVGGIITGSSLLFFGFIGFDEVRSTGWKLGMYDGTGWTFQFLFWPTGIPGLNPTPPMHRFVAWPPSPPTQVV